MKANAEQKTLIKKYLRQSLKYRETYEEFYDHILTALEHQPEGISFGNAVNHIIREDFGGAKGMYLIECRYQKTMRREMQNKYLSYVTEYLKFSAIGIIGLCSVIVCFLVMQPWFTFLVFFGVIFTISLFTRLLTTVMNRVRDFKTGYSFWGSKRSVKDSVFKGLTYIPGLAFLMIVFIPSSGFGQAPVIWFKNIDPVILTIIILIYILHTLTYCRVYKDEFKISLTN